MRRALRRKECKGRRKRGRRQETEREDQGEGVQDSGKTSTDVLGIEEGTGK